MKPMASFLIVSSLLLSWPAFTALPAETEPVNTEAAGPGEPLSIEKLLSLRDPFRRLVVISTESTEESEETPEIERFPLDQFKLVGVITGGKKNKALVAAPGGKMHVVSEASRIGMRRGVVKKISRGMVLVEERMKNILGRDETFETVLRFTDRKGKL